MKAVRFLHASEIVAAGKTTMLVGPGNLLGFGGEHASILDACLTEGVLDSIVGQKGAGAGKHAHSLSAHMGRQEPVLKFSTVTLPRAVGLSVKSQAVLAFLQDQTCAVDKKRLTDATLDEYTIKQEDSKLADQVFGSSVQVEREGCLHVGPTPHGLSSVRLVFNGTILCISLPFDGLDGAGYAAKRVNLNNMTGEHLKAVLGRCVGAGMVLAKAGNLVYTPPGSMVLALALEETRSVIWATGGGKEKLRKSLGTCTDLINTYPSFENTNYKSWKDLLLRVLK